MLLQRKKKRREETGWTGGYSCQHGKVISPIIIIFCFVYCYDPGSREETKESQIRLTQQMKVNSTKRKWSNN